MGSSSADVYVRDTVIESCTDESTPLPRILHPNENGISDAA
jgi:hypothetical protein